MPKQRARNRDDAKGRGDRRKPPVKTPGYLIVAIIIMIFATFWRYYEPSTQQPGTLCGTGFESLELACSLARTGSFSDPFKTLPTGPSAHLAPLFPAYLALLYKIGGVNGYDAAQDWSAIAMVAILLAALPILSRRFGLGLAPGLVSGVTILMAKLNTFPMWETFYLAVLTIILSSLMFDILSGRAPQTKVILTGILWGVCLWMATVPVLILLAWIAWVFVRTRIPRQHKLLLLFLPFLIISPWLIRNFKVFHHFVFMRDNLGLELAVSNNPCATFWLEINKSNGCFEINHPNSSLDQAQRVRKLGEYDYNQLRLHEAIDWIRANPGTFGDLTWLRFVAFWFPSPTGHPMSDRGIPFEVLVVWLMTLLSIGGLWLVWRRNAVAAGVLMLWLTLFPLIYYIVQFDSRYRFPILWVNFLLGGVLITEIAKQLWRASLKIFRSRK